MSSAHRTQINKLANLATKKCRIISALCLLVTSNLGHTQGLSPQDASLRRDLQALSDAGYLNTLTTTWPIAWSALQADLQQLKDKKLPAYLVSAKKNLMRATERNAASFVFSAHMYGSTEPNLLSEFGRHHTEDDSIGTKLAFHHPSWQAQLSAQAVNHATDNQNYQLDGSFISMHVRNWAAGVGQFDQWWGPGWQSSLILSHNARPIPMLYLSRQQTDPFTHKYLNWLGQWHLITFMGQLETERAVPEALLWGMRLTLSPHQNLEIGLSRTATWAGNGRPSGASTFADLLLGKDNFESDDPNKAEEPGNQLGGIDIRFARTLGQGSVAAYVQVIGEDEAGGLPSRPVVMAGTSVTIPLKQAPLTIAIEYQDTALDSYSDPILNSAYNHHIYSSGYRFRGRPIGASTDNDTQRFSWGALFQPSKRWQVAAWLSHINGNRDDVAGQNAVFQSAVDTTYAKLSATYEARGHKVTIGTNWWEDVPNNLLDRKHSVGFSLGYQWQDFR